MAGTRIRPEIPTHHQDISLFRTAFHEADIKVFKHEEKLWCFLVTLIANDGSLPERRIIELANRFK